MYRVKLADRILALVVVCFVITAGMGVQLLLHYWAKYPVTVAVCTLLGLTAFPLPLRHALSVRKALRRDPVAVLSGPISPIRTLIAVWFGYFLFMLLTLWTAMLLLRMY